MSVALMQLIATKTSDIANTRSTLAALNTHMNYLVDTLEQELYELNIKFQLATAQEEEDEGWGLHVVEADDDDDDEGWRARPFKAEVQESEFCKNWDCQNWGANTDDCACADKVDCAWFDVVVKPIDAPVTVTTTTAKPPFSPILRPAPPKTPEELSAIPLLASTDALKLKELEERFPGATMVLSTDTKQIEIRHIKIQSRDADMIYRAATNTYYANFNELGVPSWKRPNLMAEWQGMYIDLTHLFAPAF